jgi:hypothetical protein
MTILSSCTKPVFFSIITIQQTYLPLKCNWHLWHCIQQENLVEVTEQISVLHSTCLFDPLLYSYAIMLKWSKKLFLFGVVYKRLLSIKIKRCHN